MKNLLSLYIIVCLAFIANVSKAQEVTMVTLQHNDDLTVFYGANAISDAHESAVNGDLITASAGTYKGFTITKPITIQGAGYINEPENGNYRTFINGTVTIQLPDSVKGLTLEGLFLENSLYLSYDKKLTNATIRKCRLNDVSLNSGNAHTVNCLFDQCRIESSFSPDQNSDNLCIRNSVINGLYGNSESAICYIENCIINNLNGSNSSYSPTALFRNNIISMSSSYVSLKATCTAYNNVFVNGNANDCNININNTTNVVPDSLYKEGTYYELTDEAATAYLGTDGTQVGIYGGNSPYTTVPTNPQITKRNIAAQSTTDGILKVNITVEAQNK